MRYATSVGFPSPSATTRSFFVSLFKGTMGDKESLCDRLLSKRSSSPPLNSTLIDIVAAMVCAVSLAETVREMRVEIKRYERVEAKLGSTAEPAN